jgi:UDP-N-acetylglucosamine--N-acetylmuramyl-(pentapeptide) pyrophosphoryl-undecaprenol N-acetylglucosamine transferase
VVVSYKRASRDLPAGRTFLLGNPVRPELLATVTASKEKRDRSASPRCLLVLGGSQGARAINRLITDAAPELVKRLADLQIIHQTGAADFDSVLKSYARAGIAARVEPFIEDMGEVLLKADLALSRAGATTLAELCVAGVPAVLIPYPFAADDHQAENAAELAAAGGVRMIRQEDLSSAALAELLAELLSDEAELSRMSEAIQRCAFPRAAADVVKLLQSLVRRPRRTP